MSFKVEQRKSALKGLRGRGAAEKITKAEHTRLSHVWDDCARAYLRAIALSDIIKVDTGMSKASLLPIARLLKMYTEVKGSISGAKKKKGVFDIDGGWHKDGERSVAAGEASNRLKAGHNLLHGSPKRMVFVFDFEITVWQYLLRDQNSIGKDKAWQTIEVGRAAFQEHFDAHFRLTGPRAWGLHDG